MAKKNPKPTIGKRPSKAAKKKAAAKEKSSKPRGRKAKVLEDAQELSQSGAAKERQQQIDDLVEKAEGGDRDALAVLTAIVKNFHSWRAAKAETKAVAFGTRQLVKQEESAFETAVEAALPPGSTLDDASKKLTVVEHRWQELKDCKEAAEQKKKEAKENLKKWNDKLERAIAEAPQLTLPMAGAND